MFNLLDKIRYLFHFMLQADCAKKGRIAKNCKIIIENDSHLSLGEHFSLGENSKITCRKDACLTIGTNFSTNFNLFIGCRNNITIGNNVTIGPNVVIVDNDHNYLSTNRRDNYLVGNTTIGNNVWIGANCVILKGTNIGDNCVIAAGTIVKGDIPENTLLHCKIEYGMKRIHYEK